MLFFQRADDDPSSERIVEGRGDLVRGHVARRLRHSQEQQRFPVPAQNAGVEDPHDPKSGREGDDHGWGQDRISLEALDSGSHRSASRRW